MFPWKYGDDETEYKGCADPSNAGYLWCPTELDDKGKYISGKWGVCEDSCQQCQTKPGKGVGVAKCVFPWKYGSDPTEYNGCANPSKSSVGLWCPTELDDEGKYIRGKWGVCKESCPNHISKYPEGNSAHF